MVRVLIDSQRIQKRVRDLGLAISRDYAGQELMVVTILKGAAIFAADLVRSITVPLSMEFMEVHSYDGTESTAQVTMVKDLQAPVADQNLLLVEDIVDTGLTLSHLAERLEARNPRSLRICALLSKPDRRVIPVSIDYLGFSIPDEFVVGYGLDYRGHYRNLPDIQVWENAGQEGFGGTPPASGKTTVITDIYNV